MKITILQIGKTKHDFVREAEAEYLKRLQPSAKIDIITLKETGQTASTVSQKEAIKAKEAQIFLQHFPKDAYIIALDEHGKMMNSTQFASFLQAKKEMEGKDVAFIIGGPYGLGSEILQKAHLKLSFSTFTFTHEMIRMLLLEQLYRAFTIIAGKTYHY